MRATCAVMRAVDRLDKVPPEVVAKELVDSAGLSDEQAAQCLALAGIRSTDTSFVQRVRALGVTHDLLDTGSGRARRGARGLRGYRQRARVSVEADLRIARGAGLLHRHRLRDPDGRLRAPRLGSARAGRYDSLAGDGKVTYPGVGISFGVTRALMPLFQAGTLTASRAVPSAVLVALPDEDSRNACDVIAQGLRRRGIAAEVAAAPQRYGKPDPLRRAPRRPVRLVPGRAGRGRHRARHPQRGAGRRGRIVLDTARN